MGWLSPAYESHGWSAGEAGALFGVFNLIQFVTAATLPALADRFSDRRPVILFAVTLTSVGAVWLWAFPDVLPWVAVCIVGLGLGGGFSLGLVLVVDYAAGPGAAGRLTAMVFLVCYTGAAITPVVVGALRDATGGFGLPFGLLTLIAVTQFTLATRLRPAHRGTVA
jgi:CP family cyanate transporter-like MFS transporter